MAIDPDLAEIAAVLERIPPHVLEPTIADAKQVMTISAAILRRAGAYLVPAKAPALRFGVKHFQDVILWGRSWDWVGGKVEAAFPSAVSYLKDLATAFSGTGDAPR